ncbi:hypothetical protein MKX03_005681, partial [Papaver bracteatum]
MSICCYSYQSIYFFKKLMLSFYWCFTLQGCCCWKGSLDTANPSSSYFGLIL